VPVDRLDVADLAARDDVGLAGQRRVEDPPAGAHLGGARHLFERHAGVFSRKLLMRRTCSSRARLNTRACGAWRATSRSAWPVPPLLRARPSSDPHGVQQITTATGRSSVAPSTWWTLRAC